MAEITNNYPGLIPDRQGFEPPDGKSYQPSNGTEGIYFQERWCEHCKADKAFRDGGYENGSEGCNILARTMAREAGE